MLSSPRRRFWPSRLAIGEILEARAHSRRSARAGEPEPPRPDADLGFAANPYSRCVATRRARRADIETLARLARDNSLQLWIAFGGFLDLGAWALGRSGRPPQRNAARDGEFAEHVRTLYIPVICARLAELRRKAARPEAALRRSTRSRRNRAIGTIWFDAELHRIRGEILLKQNPAEPAPAEAAFLAAIAIAQQQKARSFELRAALSLAKLYQSTGRPAEAHAVLTPALEGFAPTPEMPEIAQAQALLAALAETDGVKAEATHRQRLTQLHVSYGNALIAARGYGAPETTEAFARAHESTAGDKDAPGRLAADYGLWVGSYTRGDLPSMRAHAAAFLNDAEASPDSPEAGVAHRAAGLTHWFAGEYREAREHLERALALFQPGRDDDLAFRFGHDAGAGAMLYLALTLWPLGDTGRAVSLICDAEARIAGLAHTATRAHAKWHVAMFWLMRGDLSRAAPNAAELATLTRESELSLWRARGVFLDGLSMAENGRHSGALDAMRRGVEFLREQNVLVIDGLIKIALAEAEARAGDVDRAVAVLDEALATSDRTGHRAFEAELHQSARRNSIEMRPRQARCRGRSLPDRNRGREAASHAQLRTSRRACGRQALPIDRPRRRRPPRPRPGARRLRAD